jgi:hypothetical protein
VVREVDVDRALPIAVMNKMEVFLDRGKHRMVESFEGAEAKVVELREAAEVYEEEMEER